MKSKSAGKIKRRTKAARPWRRGRPKNVGIAEQSYPSPDELSYEKALAKSMLDHELPPECDDAVTLAAAVSSLTTSLKRLSYNYGLTVGRSVYRLFEGRKSYRWYGDSIQDIVLFLERLGYGYILYKILTDNVEVSIYRKGRANLGCNIHSFDAGVIAGFLGAARGDFVRVSEVSCCNNGAECCRFTTSGSLGDPFCTEIKMFSTLLESAPSAGMIRPEYQLLVTEPLMRGEYSSQIEAVFFHLGQEAASTLPDGKITAKALQAAASAMTRFGLGKLEYSSRPLKIAIRLDGVKAKKEFVDISISFLNGMVGRHFSKPLKFQLTTSRNGSYRIVVKQ